TRPITEGEKISLLALVSFVADSLGQPEDRVHQTLQEALNIASLDAISAQHYDHAIQFLVDQVPQNTVTA
ncbi:MAG: hypothetical protein EB121_07300, partial [Alphaproteobacteria bacterium]|nr:hypothetical protein [Alphaproteobacteria bacterium]